METNPQREEYLTTIFRLMRYEKKITNKMLSERLNLAPSSITEMLKKLKKDGFIKDTRNVALSELGETVAKEILSKHRLWEYFFMENLKYSWKDVHEHAQKFQSVTSDDLMNRLNEFLGYPEYCPHGAIIYKNNEESNHELIRMSNAKVKSSYVIRRITDKRDLLEYSEEMGIEIGKKIVLKEFDKFDNTAIVKIGDDIIRISPKACKDIYLKEINL